MLIVCPKCGAVLRKIAGVHSAGEPMGKYGDGVLTIPCPQCRHLYRDDTDEPRDPRSEQGRSARLD
jgi:uncharacterized C2H2 Zn-finger protein